MLFYDLLSPKIKFIAQIFCLSRIVEPKQFLQLSESEKCLLGRGGITLMAADGRIAFILEMNEKVCLQRSRIGRERSVEEW